MLRGLIASVWTTGNFAISQVVQNTHAGHRVPVTIPPIPDGYRAEAWWLSNGYTSRYRVYTPPSVIEGAAFIEMHFVNLYLLKAGDARASLAELRTPGFQVTGVEVETTARLTAYRALSGGELQFNAEGVALIVFIPRDA
jgi:hypothetical protein